MQVSPRSADQEVSRGPAFSREELLTVDEMADVLRVRRRRRPITCGAASSRHLSWGALGIRSGRVLTLTSKKLRTRTCGIDLGRSNRGAIDSGGFEDSGSGSICAIDLTTREAINEVARPEPRTRCQVSGPGDPFDLEPLGAAAAGSDRRAGRVLQLARGNSTRQVARRSDTGLPRGSQTLQRGPRG
jgi:hypothetical protein